MANTKRAEEFFGEVFSWEFQASTASGVRQAVARSSGDGASVMLIFTDDPTEPTIRLGFTVSDVAQAARQVEQSGGKVERQNQRAVWSLDSQATPLLLHPGISPPTATTRPSRGALGVIFVFANSPDRAAEFYKRFAYWDFDSIGRDRDILFVQNGPTFGIRAANKSPHGQSGIVQFHISVADSQAVVETIKALGGQVGPEQAAGVFTTRACTDEQDTAFSLWYQPTPTANPLQL